MPIKVSNSGDISWHAVPRLTVPVEGSDVLSGFSGEQERHGIGGNLGLRRLKISETRIFLWSKSINLRFNLSCCQIMVVS